jgi:hypothetical protein
LAFSAVEWRLDRFMSEDVAMADASAHGPLDPSSGGREAALAARWRRLRDGVPSTLYLLGWALVLLVALVALGWLLAKVVPSSAVGEHTIRGIRALSWENRGRALVRRVPTPAG